MSIGRHTHPNDFVVGWHHRAARQSIGEDLGHARFEDSPTHVYFDLRGAEAAGELARQNRAHSRRMKGLKQI